MRQGLGQSQRTEVGVGLKIDPRVVLASRLLQLGQLELEQAIETELNENPALERLQEDFEALDDEAILRAVAPQELRRLNDDYECARCQPNDDAPPDWIDLASSTPTLLEHLRAQLLPMLDPSEQRLGSYMIECVNEKGYLSTPIEELALATGSSIEQVEAVLAKLRECEPAGVGATNLQECLLLQLRKADTVELKLARSIVRSHLDDFLARRVQKLCRRFRVLPSVVEAAFAEILSLSPFPGEALAHSTTRTGRRATGVVPDLALSRTESGWSIEVRGAEPSTLTISRAYRRRLRELAQMERAPQDEKRHIQAYVQRATDFITSLQQRRKTLRRIGEYLAEHQSGFVTTGSYRFLAALTRAQMAADLGLHESTISRATMDKFVQIANGEIVPFEVFFKPALRVQKMIEEILSTENPGNPLSDERISQILAERGVFVARRTVNKYRDRTRLLSSRKRRTA